MDAENLKHALMFSKAGDVVRTVIGWIGLRFLRSGQSMLRWSLYRCSLCGGNPGFSSSISSRGLRCSMLNRHCDFIE